MRKAKKQGRRSGANKLNIKTSNYLIGRQIRSKEVICIDNNNSNLGKINIQEALSLAESVNLDLVQVSPPKDGKLPVCKVIDYGKLKYELTKKEKASQKKQRENAIKTKEIKFRPVTHENDLAIKAKQMQPFIDEGNKVKITIVMKGREMSHKNVAYDTLEKFVGMVVGAEIIVEPSQSGKHISTIISKVVPEKAA